MKMSRMVLPVFEVQRVKLKKKTTLFTSDYLVRFGYYD